MAFVVKRVKMVVEHLITDDWDVYTCPAYTLAKITHIQVANVDGSNDANVSISVYDPSTEATAYLAKTVSVPANTPLKVLGDCSGLWLTGGGSIGTKASANDALDLVMSVIEYGLPESSPQQ